MARTSTLSDPIARRAVIMSDSGAGSSQGGGSQGGGQQVDPGRSIYQPVVHEDDVADLDGDRLIRKGSKRKNCGPLDKFVMSLPPDILKGGKDMKGVFGACDKDLRDKVCEGISRWFKDVGILFDAASLDSFKEMTELIRQYAVIMSDAGAGSSQGGGSQGGGQQVDLGRSIYQPVVHEDDVEDLDGDQPIRKGSKRKNCGPLDKFVMSLPPDILKGGKDMKGVFGACDKDLRDKVCEGISRWFKDAGILFDAASHDRFNEMTELIGQYGMREEWAVKGCSIMSNGWHDYVVQKDIVNFLVNLPKGSVHQSKRYGPLPSHLELVDEDDDVEEELGEGVGYEKDLDYEEHDSESELSFSVACGQGARLEAPWCYELSSNLIASCCHTPFRTKSKRYGPSPSHLELVDEDDDVEEELGEGVGYEKDLEYEEHDSESE
ncbi:hypothetical protein DY000_02002394 [Brassica cretica]|uniref:Uncharacterized protein n=1 Tax=Brassica cretica TaxID=69181 RepID=A0ABQ7CE09_BRACR|nr:hypothetical protein DY000_02002394 [Brassica cretica]